MSFDPRAIGTAFEAILKLEVFPKVDGSNTGVSSISAAIAVLVAFLSALTSLFVGVGLVDVSVVSVLAAIFWGIGARVWYHAHPNWSVVVAHVSLACFWTAVTLVTIVAVRLLIVRNPLSGFDQPVSIWIVLMLILVAALRAKVSLQKRIIYSLLLGATACFEIFALTRL